MHTAEERKVTSGDIESVNFFDPYLYHAEMSHTAVYYPLGFPLELTTNSEIVLQAAKESWGSFKPQFDTPDLQIRVGVLEDGSAEYPAALTFRAHRNLIVGIADRYNFHITDVTHGFSFVWLNTAAILNRNYLRYHFLEAVALSHIANRYTAPIHAACVELNGRGVLLCGDSGAGKSSLAFACARAGWTYITDDASFLLNAQSDRKIVGNCHMMRFRPSAAELFAEVVGKPLTPRAGRNPSIELLTETVPGISTASSSSVDFIVFLNRQDVNIQELVPFSKKTARRIMCPRLSNMEEFRRTQVASVDRLLETEIFEIRYRNLDWAVDRLVRLVKEKE
jgi:hypothetical protein